jgi:hypothetical protein
MIHIVASHSIDHHLHDMNVMYFEHSYDILGARMLWKPKEARILKNFLKIYRSTSVIW